MLTIHYVCLETSHSHQLTVQLISIPAAELWVGLPVWDAAGTFGKQCAFVAGFAAADVAADAADAADVAALHTQLVACAAVGAEPG